MGCILTTIDRVIHRKCVICNEGLRPAPVPFGPVPPPATATTRHDARPGSLRYANGSDRLTEMLTLDETDVFATLTLEDSKIACGVKVGIGASCVGRAGCGYVPYLRRRTALIGPSLPDDECEALCEPLLQRYKICASTELVGSYDGLNAIELRELPIDDIDDACCVRRKRQHQALACEARRDDWRLAWRTTVDAAAPGVFPCVIVQMLQDYVDPYPSRYHRDDLLDRVQHTGRGRFPPRPPAREPIHCEHTLVFPAKVSGDTPPPICASLGDPTDSMPLCSSAARTVAQRRVDALVASSLLGTVVFEASRCRTPSAFCTCRTQARDDGKLAAHHTSSSPGSNGTRHSSPPISNANVDAFADCPVCAADSDALHPNYAIHPHWLESTDRL